MNSVLLKLLTTLEDKLSYQELNEQSIQKMVIFGRLNTLPNGTCAGNESCSGNRECVGNETCNDNGSCNRTCEVG